MQVFTRQTSKGALECSIGANCQPVFCLDGKVIKQGSIAGIVMISDMTAPFYSDLRSALEKAGAVACWNSQVALFGNEPELIAHAIDAATKAKSELEREIIAGSDIVVIDRLYNGAPAIAENHRFAWSSMQSDSIYDKEAGRSIYQGAYLKKEALGSDPISEQTRAIVAKFRSELTLIIRRAEKAYKIKKAEEIKAIRPPVHLRGLSLSEIERKAALYDKINNEGGEGYNPYK